MRVLLTGREGQLARSLAELAPRFPAIDLVPLGRPELDLERPETLTSAVERVRPDVVLNAAAYTAVDQAEDEPERAFRVNAEGPGALAAAAKRAGARTVQISTDYVFDGTGAGSYREDAPTAPLGVYGRSKLEGERRVHAADPDAVIVRTAWVYSPFGRNFVKTMMALARDRDELTVVGDQHGNPSDALGLAEGLLTMLDSWSENSRQGAGRVYHLAGSGDAHWAQFAGVIMEACADLGAPTAAVRPIATADWPTKAPRPRNSRLDSSAFARDFGFAMPPWQDSTRATVRRLAAAQG